MREALSLLVIRMNVLLTKTQLVLGSKGILPLEEIFRFGRKQRWILELAGLLTSASIQA